jgi:hypothetical protein
MEYSIMRGKNRFWILLLAIGLLAVSGCTENGLDESDADVFLSVVGFEAGPVIPGATTGTCSLNAAITCLQDSTCSDQGAGNCDLDGGILCELPMWKYDFMVEPLNAGASQTPLNNVEIVSVDVVYTGGLAIAPRTLELGVVIPVGGSGSIEFTPINEEDLTSDSTSVNLAFTWHARSLNGQTVEVQGGGGNTLNIQDCLP